MDRLGFLKRIGILAGASLIPADSILAVTDFVEKKTDKSKGLSNVPANELYKNHMTIQRKAVSITGGAKSDVIWYEYEIGGKKNQIWMNKKQYDIYQQL